MSQLNCCSRRGHAADFRGSVGRAMSRLLENGLKSVNPRGYQGGQGWLWWALTRSSLMRSRRAGFSTQQQRQLPDKLKTCRHGGTARIVPNTTDCVPFFGLPFATRALEAGVKPERESYLISTGIVFSPCLTSTLISELVPQYFSGTNLSMPSEFVAAGRGAVDLGTK